MVVGWWWWGEGRREGIALAMRWKRRRNDLFHEGEM